MQCSTVCEPRVPDIQAGFRKGRGNRSNSNIHWIIEKAREFQKKTSTSASLTMLKLLTVWNTTNWKFLKRWEYQTTLPASCKTCMQVKKQQLELDMEQHAGSKLGKEYVKAIYCHPAYLTYMQSTSCETRGGWSTNESKLPEEMSKTSDMQMTPPLW